MNKATLLSIALLGIIGAAMLTSDISSAGTMAGLGHSAALEATCFDEIAGSILNSCAGFPQNWEVTDTVNVAGNHTMLVTALMPSGGTVDCTACAFTKEGFSTGCTAVASPKIVNTDTQFTVGTVNVPSAGGITVGCYLGQNAWYDSVSGF